MTIQSAGIWKSLILLGVALIALGAVLGSLLDPFIGLAAVMVLVGMPLAFGLREAGLTRTSQYRTILQRNLLAAAVCSAAFALTGYGIIFSNYDPAMTAAAGDGAVELPNVAFWIVQTSLCATATVIVAGAMAERVHCPAFLIFSLIMGAFIYPCYADWARSGLSHTFAWLPLPASWPAFRDDAGAVAVHVIGGWCALAAILCLGPRIGRFDAAGKPRLLVCRRPWFAVVGSALIVLGCVAFEPLWWSGRGREPFPLQLLSAVLVAAICGGTLAFLVGRKAFGRWRRDWIIDGALAGSVAASAGCITLAPLALAATGAIAGVALPFVCTRLERYRLDDPVGAVSIHLVNGAWGAIAVGLFAAPTASTAGGLIAGQVALPLAQFIAVLLAGLWAFPIAFLTFKLTDLLIGIRVSHEVEEFGSANEGLFLQHYQSGIVLDGNSAFELEADWQIDGRADSNHPKPAGPSAATLRAVRRTKNVLQRA